MKKKEHITNEVIVKDFNPLIAHVWQNTSTITEYADRYNHLIYCYEAILKYLAAILYGRLSLFPVETIEVDTFIKENFDEPSFGDWSTLIRLSRKLLVSENDIWAKQLDLILQSKINCGQTLTVFHTCKKLQGFTSNIQSISIGELLKTIIDLRNRTKGHGAVRKGFYNEINDSLEHSLLDLMTICKDAFTVPFFLVDKIEYDSSNRKMITTRTLSGIAKSLKAFPFSSETPLLTNRLYACSSNNIEDCFSVWPFIHWDENTDDLFVFNMVKRDRAEFISYKSGGNKFLDIGSFENLFKFELAIKKQKKIFVPIQISSKGIVHNLPSPDWYYFVPRPELEKTVIEKLTHPRLYIITLDGIGGSGKTALALKIAFDIADSSTDYDYVVWVTAKRTKLEASGIKKIQQTFSSLPDLLKEILRVSGFSEYENLNDVDVLKSLTFEILSLARFLIIIDNLETVEDAISIWQFLVDPSFAFPTKVIVTSRHRQESAELVVNVRGMTFEQVKQLVIDESTRLNFNLTEYLSDSIITTLLEKTGGLPLAIKQVVAHSSYGLPLLEAISRLPKKTSDVIDFCFPESFKLLDENAKIIFFILFKLLEPAGYEELQFISNLSDSDLSKALSNLKSLSLIERSLSVDQKELYYLLPLTLSFASREITSYINIEESILPRLAELDQLRLMMPLDQSISSISGIVTPERMLQLALSAASKGAFDKADYWFDKAITSDRSNVTLWLAKAKYEAKDKQDIDSARLSFSKAVQLDSNNTEALIHWGHIERSEKNWAKAKELFSNALKLDSNNNRASHGLGLTLFEQGVYEKEYGKKQSDQRRIIIGSQLIQDSIGKLIYAIIPEPQNEPERHHNVVTYSVLSRAWNRTNDNKKAISACEEGLRLEPYNFRLKNWLNQLRQWN